MKEILIGLSILTCFHFSSFSQTHQPSLPENNGLNLEGVCSLPQCLYAAIPGAIQYPEDSSVQWAMNNVEVALKSNGKYLITSDFSVIGEELGAIVNLELQFYDYENQLIQTLSSGELQLYAEQGYAEPFVWTGDLGEETGQRTDYFALKVTRSEIVPYYELNNNCYLPCKNEELKTRIKEFKKSK
ncbi:hypothetical protein BFP72_06940 [Reichenbachiella sp. 5M10]|uniref:hypothetical protein n=1 Tax=Reichenbachiella sp. 5M10 TaxID=1889772 RepID=UPI000C154DEE|nr:hypothetical protein [Reichenbachiella sp. 5M10]PIB35150.1 hypothetical protein BFP72_06940 [Reichenbachiella sp. 5M10]